MLKQPGVLRQQGLYNLSLLRFDIFIDAANYFVCSINFSKNKLQYIMAALEEDEKPSHTSAESFKDTLLIRPSGTLFEAPTSNSSSSMSPCQQCTIMDQSCQLTLKRQKPTASDDEVKPPALPKSFAIGMMETDPIKEAEKRAARLARFGPVEDNDSSLIRNSGDRKMLLAASSSQRHVLQGFKRDHEGHIKSQRRGRSRFKSDKIAHRNRKTVSRAPR